MNNNDKFIKSNYVSSNPNLKKFLLLQRKRLRNTDFSLFTESCAGGLISKELGLPYRSPQVSMMIMADLVEFLENLEYYLHAELTEVKTIVASHPVGLLGGKVLVHFNHMNHFSEGVQRWERRKARVNLNNIFCMMTDRYENARHYKRFLALPYPKVYYSSKSIDHPDVFHQTRFDGQECVSALPARDGLYKRRSYWDFDLVAWFNARGAKSARDIVMGK